jgi:hypothetical protein
MVMIVGGASTLAGYSSVLQADLQQLSSSLSDFISPEMAHQLTDMINYAPKVLVLVGAFLALISFAGCCGAFSKSRCASFFVIQSRGFLFHHIALYIPIFALMHARLRSYTHLHIPLCACPAAALRDKVTGCSIDTVCSLPPGTAKRSLAVWACPSSHHTLPPLPYSHPHASP